MFDYRTIYIVSIKGSTGQISRGARQRSSLAVLIIRHQGFPALLEPQSRLAHHADDGPQSIAFLGQLVLHLDGNGRVDRALDQAEFDGQVLCL
ncbi:hypothetical protein HA62_13015 [Pseudomonas putida]|nr:hypothetical protein HA62_13015 [Pseudomonas putida]